MVSYFVFFIYLQCHINTSNILCSKSSFSGNSSNFTHNVIGICILTNFALKIDICILKMLIKFSKSQLGGNNNGW